MTVHFDFSGQTVLIAGAASGIGRASALALLETGATVLAMDIDEAGLAQLTRHPRLLIARVDIADSVAVGAAVDAWVAKTGRIDGAVLTSAIQRRVFIDHLSDADWRRHLDVNLSGIFFLLRALFPIMKRQRSGSIITFTSGLATNGWPGAAAYAASKAGIVGLVKSAALELRDYGVRVNVLSPGLVSTPVFLNVATDDEVAMYERTLGVSTPEEVAPTILHLLSDAAATLTGTIIERRLVPRATASTTTDRQ